MLPKQRPSTYLKKRGSEFFHLRRPGNNDDQNGLVKLKSASKTLRISIMSPSKPLIYAELLSNIRQVSVIVALDTPSDPTTKAELSADGGRFILHHGGQTTTLNLPGQAMATFQIQRPTLGGKELSWRLPLAGQASRTSIEDAQSNEVPWSAKDLSGDAEFACCKCSAIIVKAGTIKVWKDLPSENWAEMMDFWHCHKPDVPALANDRKGANGQASHDQAKVATSKGYGASTKFLASAGYGLVDTATFLLDSADCTNIKVSSSPFTWFFFPFSFSECHGYQEGGYSSLSRFSGLVTDTNTQDQHLVSILRLRGGKPAYPLLLTTGYLFTGGSASAFHSISSSRYWEAMGLARGTP